MRSVSATRRIPAPPERLFAFLADPANLPAWQTGIVSAERTSPGPLGAGSTAHVVRQLMGQRISVDLRLTEYEPPRRLALGSAASGIEVQATLELEPGDDGSVTDLTFAMTIRAQSIFMAPVEGMVAGAAERDVADSLARLQDHFAG